MRTLFVLLLDLGDGAARVGGWLIERYWPGRREYRARIEQDEIRRQWNDGTD